MITHKQIKAKTISEEVCLAFIAVAGVVFGIEMGRRGWSDKDMKLFNDSIIEIRDILIDNLEALKKKTK